MGLWTRMKRSMRALFGGILEKTEDPELILQQTIRDMRDRIPDLNNSVAQVMATEKLLAKNKDRLEGQVVDLDSKIKASVKMGRDDIATAYIGQLSQAQLDLPGNPRRCSLHVTTGFVCLVVGLLFYYGSVLDVPLKHTDLFDLGPYPDAVEYFAQANSILKEGAPTIPIAYDKLPSRYPPGYPVLMIPRLRFLPHNGILAPFRTNQTVGLLLLTGSFVFYFAIGRAL